MIPTAKWRNDGAGTIPIIVRSMVGMDNTGGSFSGMLTGGNGRPGAPGQTLTYGFDVPGGMSDLGLNITLKDLSYNLQGVLVNPQGLPVDIQSTITDTRTHLFTYENALQFFRRNPEAGRWLFVLFINGTVSGRQTAMPFTGHIAFNTVRVSAPGLPDDPAVHLTQGVARKVELTIQNTGAVPESFFVDPRLAALATLHLTTVSANLPLTTRGPSLVLPPEATDSEGVLRGDVASRLHGPRHRPYQ